MLLVLFFKALTEKKNVKIFSKFNRNNKTIQRETRLKSRL